MVLLALALYYLTLPHPPTNAISPRNESSINQRDGLLLLFSKPLTLITGNSSNFFPQNFTLSNSRERLRQFFETEMTSELKHWLVIGSYLWKYIINDRAVNNTLHLSGTESLNINSLKETKPNNDIARNLLDSNDRFNVSTLENEIQSKDSKPSKLIRRALDKDNNDDPTDIFVHVNRSRRVIPKHDAHNPNTNYSAIDTSDAQKWDFIKSARSPSNLPKLESSNIKTAKELYSHLPWSGNNSASSLLAANNKVMVQTLDTKEESGDLQISKIPVISGPLPRLYSNSDPSSIFVSANKSRKLIPQNDISYIDTESSKISSQVELKRIEFEQLNGLGYNDSSNLQLSLKRSRRQAGNETEGLELPHWPGAPLPLRQQATTLQPPPLPYVKKKILSMMLQSLYSAQERLWPLEPIMKKYEHLAPYRMAFIFMKLDQLVHEGHSIMMYLDRQTVNPAMTITRRLQMYSQLMRRNVDVTYLVDYIMQRVPRDQMVRIRQWVIRNEQQGLLQHKLDYDRTYATYYLARPD